MSASGDHRLDGRPPGYRLRTGIASLTKVEELVAAHVADGKENSEIAKAMFVAPQTVKFHLTRIFRKLEVRNRVELAMAVARAGAWLCCGREIYTPFCPWCGGSKAEPRQEAA